MEEEMVSLKRYETRDLVPLPNGTKPIDSKWVFKKKVNATRQVENYKDQLVVRGYSKIEGIKCDNILSHVSKITSIRVVLYLATTVYLEIEQMDVKTTFLHGDLEDQIYMKNHEGFIVKLEKELICKINKSIYGLKESPKMWYLKFHMYIQQLKFVSS